MDKRNICICFKCCSPRLLRSIRSKQKKFGFDQSPIKFGPRAWIFRRSDKNFFQRIHWIERRLAHLVGLFLQENSLAPIPKSFAGIPLLCKAREHGTKFVF